MKYILAFVLSTSFAFPQAVLFNTPTHFIYVVDFNQTPIEILSIHESTYLPIVCLNKETKRLKDVNFSNSPHCLMNSINAAFNFSATHYVDMKNTFTKEEIKQIVKEKRMSQILSLIHNTSTSYSLFELIELYNVTKNKAFQYTFIYPTSIKINEGFIPLNR